MSTKRGAFGLLSGALLVLTVMGCGKVVVKPVSYADRTTPGVRFYRPRPYLAVKQPFPIAGEDYVVTGQVSDDGTVVSVDASRLPEFLRERFGAKGSGDKIDVPAVSVSTQLRPQGGAPAPPQTPSTKDKKKEEPEKEADTQPGTKQQSKEETTKADVTTCGNPTTKPVEQVNDHFDLVYLPDFEEQYVVDVNAGWGSASASVGLENGWMAEGVTMNVDNTQLAAFFLRNVEKVIDLGLAVAEPGLAQLMGVKTEAGLPAADTVAKMRGRTVLLRVRYVVEAQRGLYPILKPWEKPGNVASPSKPHYLELPCQPFTVVPFNVHRTALIELIVPRSTGPDSPGGRDGTETKKLQALAAALKQKGGDLKGWHWEIVSATAVPKKEPASPQDGLILKLKVGQIENATQQAVSRKELDDAVRKMIVGVATSGAIGMSKDSAEALVLTLGPDAELAKLKPPKP
jgi:hypothetical protein